MQTARRILLVEDEIKIAEVLSDFLGAEGFETQTQGDGGKVLDQVHNWQPDLIILDVMLPNKDGLTLCKEIRQFSNVPIIMATARVEEIDRLLGLGIGADDYVCKPFSPREVVARVNAILRRTQTSEIPKQGPLVYGAIEMDRDRYSCRINGEPIQLTPVEFRLLAYLVEKPGYARSRDSLMSVCYEDERVVSARTIDSHMKNLRAKLGAAESLVQSVYGIGYKVE